MHSPFATMVGRPSLDPAAPLACVFSQSGVLAPTPNTALAVDADELL